MILPNVALLVSEKLAEHLVTNSGPIYAKLGEKFEQIDADALATKFHKGLYSIVKDVGLQLDIRGTGVDVNSFGHESYKGYAFYRSNCTGGRYYSARLEGDKLTVGIFNYTLGNPNLVDVLIAQGDTPDGWEGNKEQRAIKMEADRVRQEATNAKLIASSPRLAAMVAKFNAKKK